MTTEIIVCPVCEGTGVVYGIIDTAQPLKRGAYPCGCCVGRGRVETEVVPPLDEEPLDVCAACGKPINPRKGERLAWAGGKMFHAKCHAEKEGDDNEC